MRARARSTRCRRAAERRNTVDRQPDRLPDADLDPRTERRCRSAGCLLRQRRTPPAAGNAVRFLAVPDERLPHLRGAVRRVCRAGPLLRGRPVGRRPVRPAARGGQHRPAAVLVHHLWLRDDRDAGQAPGPDAGLAGRHRSVRPRVPGHRAVRVPSPDPRGRWPAAQCLPVQLLHAGRHARPARHLRLYLAGDLDGPGRQARPDHRQPPAPDVPVDVLALPGRRLDRRLHLRLSDGVHVMAADHSHDHHDDHHDDDGFHVSYQGYATGFILSVILTAIPFWLVMGKVLGNPKLTGLVILGFAAVQMVVHMVYFLHMNAKVEGGWSMLALLFTVALVVIMLAGSVWVMYHMNTNMMPTPDPAAMRNMP
mmetsp:Transcript_1233/g.3445  ORF Transcript_1233/g.3445 Transcript_1233/m.3445 type:complete len:367 (+) Transcript_1233:1610-2710(+)